jgi:hypothetical protein
MNYKTDFTTIHEGFLRDIISMAGKAITTKSPQSVWDWAKSASERRYNSPQDEKSKFDKVISQNIATAAKGLTAVFPVIVTEATPIDQAIMISKAVERKCVGLLEMLFASASIGNVSNAYDYLSKFHNNIDDKLDWSNANIDDILDAGVDVNRAFNGKGSLNAATEIAIRDGMKAVQEDVKQNCRYYLDECLNPNSINDYLVRQVFGEASINIRHGVRTSSRTVDNGDGSTTRYDDSDAAMVTDIKNAYDVLNKGIIKTDVDKANEAMPSLMVVRFTSVGDLGDAHNTNAIENVCVIGVKAMIHYVSSSDMVNKIMLKNSDRRGLFNFIRATTREISFFKDFLFSVDRAKVDALSKVGRGSSSSIWKLLELRANQAKRNKQFKNDASCSAIATIVISKEEADLIKKYHRLDIKNPGTLLSIMRGYSFMCAVIVDEAMERVDMLWDDGTKNFETYSFMSLEREESSGMYKKVINMVSKR